MKMTKEHYQELSDLIQHIPNKPTSKQYIDQGFSMERYRWDLLWAIDPRGDIILRRLHDYLNDDHIDTALRHITGTKR